MPLAFPYQLAKQDYPNGMCVYKIIVGKKYFIWKCKNFHHSVESQMKDIYRKASKGYNLGDPQSKLVDYVQKSRVTKCWIEVISYTVDPLKLLELEREALEAGSSDEYCLNLPGVQGVPKWLQEIIDSGQVAVIPDPVPADIEKSYNGGPFVPVPQSEEPVISEPVVKKETIKTRMAAPKKKKLHFYADYEFPEETVLPEVIPQPSPAKKNTLDDLLRLMDEAENS